MTADEWTQDVLRYWDHGVLDSPDREVWVAWFARHGVDPQDVAVPGLVIRSERRYQLLYQAYRPSTEAPGLYLATVTYQLEGPPLPFPETQDDPGAAVRWP